MKSLENVRRLIDVTRSQWQRILRTTARISDRDRWAAPESFREEWDERTALLAAWVAPGSRVLEFGAGRLALERLLPRGCTYTPSDIVARDARTIVCDLNAPVLPTLGTHDVIVFSGVLEYVAELDALLAKLDEVAPRVLASYAVVRRAKPDEILLRRSHGFMTDFDRESFESAFVRRGYRVAATHPWGEQLLFDFVRAR